MTTGLFPDCAFDDPACAAPYPEFDDEVFQIYRGDGLSPAELIGAEAIAYAKWLEGSNSALSTAPGCCS